MRSSAHRLTKGRAPLRTLNARLITVLTLLLALACAAIGMATYVALNTSLMSALNQQLQAATTNWVGCLGKNTPGQGSVPGGGSAEADRYVASTQAAGHREGHPPPGLSIPACAGYLQTSGTLQIVLSGNMFLQRHFANGAPCRPSPADKQTLLSLPTTKSPTMTAAHSYDLALNSLGRSYLLTKVSGPNDTTVITGLPLTNVQDTLRYVEVTELAVFGGVLVLVVGFGTGLVRLSLRPLRRVAATATQVTELPLDSGEVTLPAGVPYNDPRTEVGQVGAAFNRMLGHVERALGRRAASEATLRRFAADASHELRTPLSSIRGYAEFALSRGGPVSDEVKHALTRVHAESERMSELVEELLLLAKLDAGRPLEREPVDLSRLAIDVLSDAQAAKSDHRWRLKLPDYPVVVLGDEHRLHQVLANVLGNAGKHTPPGSTVTLAMAAPPSLPVEICITDDGPGIPPQLLPELFERFTRADTSRSRNGSTAGSSTGLGLAIVDAVVTAHGGSIAVTSRPGMTRFTIALPAMPTDAQAQLRP